MPFKAVLTDIEGTIASVAFVKDVMFPFARARLREFLDAHGAEDKVAALLAETRTLGGLAVDAPLAEVAATLEDWIDADRKAPPLKALQGLIWRSGFESGALVAELYPDALAALRAWQEMGLPIHVYSSGSVEAQDLFFGHTTGGDLRPLFSGFYDTRTGPKDDPQSYKAIAAIMGVFPADILFLTDSVAEMRAAKDAGMQVLGVDRDKAGTKAPEGVRVVADFSGLR